MRILKLASIGLAMFATGCGSVPPINGFANSINGQEKVIHNFSFWNADCSPNYFHVKILKHPQNGELKVRKSTTTIPKKADIGTVSVLCSGQKIPSKQVVYIANPGYKGTDEIVVSVRAPNSPNAQSYKTALTVN